jgi:transcriptional regulator with XRE-family HTH domain
MAFVNNLRNVRITKHKKQSEVAQFLGISQRGYSKYEHSTMLHYDVLLNLSRYYDEPIEKLFIEL